MLETIKKALAGRQIEVYSIQESLAESLELYFIRRKLDMRRRTKVRRYTVTVYNDFEENGIRCRGSASVAVGDGMDTAELEEKLRSAYFAASFAKNKWYPLPEHEVSAGIVDTDESLAQGWDAMAMELAEAAFAADVQPEVFLNSMEIFARKNTVHLVNSQGVDVSYIKYGLDGEFVAQCPKPQDVETYESFAYERFDRAAIQAKVGRVLQLTKDRASAVTAAPAGNYRLILSDKYVSTLMSYFSERSNAGLIYPGYSNYKVGDDVQTAGSADPVTGDRLNIRLLATVPYSREGIRMRDRILLENGVLKTIHGGSRFCYYLGAEPTGDYSKLSVAPGTAALEDMKKEPYLHVVNFSDFQMDSLSGSFGGEIRLAYVYDGKTVTPVTGGSVNGNILQAQKRLALSVETQDGTEFCGPLAVCMDDVTVAGV